MKSKSFSEKGIKNNFSHLCEWLWLQNKAEDCTPVLRNWLLLYTLLFQKPKASSPEARCSSQHQSHASALNALEQRSSLTAWRCFLQNFSHFQIFQKLGSICFLSFYHHPFCHPVVSTKSIVIHIQLTLLQHSGHQSTHGPIWTVVEMQKIWTTTPPLDF